MFSFNDNSRGGMKGEDEQFMLCQGASRRGNINANQQFLFIAALRTQRLPGYLPGIFPCSVTEVIPHSKARFVVNAFFLETTCFLFNFCTTVVNLFLSI